MWYCDSVYVWVVFSPGKLRGGLKIKKIAENHETVTLNYTVLQSCRNVKVQSCEYWFDSGSVWIIMKYWFQLKLDFSGPDEEQQKVDPHHTVVFGDGDCVKVENKVRNLSSLYRLLWGVQSKSNFSFSNCLIWKFFEAEEEKILCKFCVTEIWQRWQRCFLFPPQGSEVSHFVLIAGEPIKEPVVQHGTSYVLFSPTHCTKYVLRCVLRCHKQNLINTCNVILSCVPLRSVCNDHRGRDQTGYEGLPHWQQWLWKGHKLEVQDQRLSLNAVPGEDVTCLLL